MADKQLTCKDCGTSFMFNESEQRFYFEKGFNSEPIRCKDCRMARKANRDNFSHSDNFFSARSKTARYF